ncbi:hypothetical protein FRC08_014926, partial [Ceratobasidium sp. 394]
MSAALAVVPTLIAITLLAVIVYVLRAYQQPPLAVLPYGQPIIIHITQLCDAPHLGPRLTSQRHEQLEGRVFLSTPWRIVVRTLTGFRLIHPEDVERWTPATTTQIFLDLELQEFQSTDHLIPRPKQAIP